MPTPSTAPHQVRILPMAGADAARFLAVDESAFFFDRTGVTLEQATAELDWSRCFAATPDPAGTPAGEERLAGVYASYDMALSAPGPQGGCSPVPMSGLTWVGVHPDHRRRGVLRAMMRHHLDEVHESGLAPLSGLHAAEVGIYGRFGYGVASLETRVELGRRTALQAPGLEEAAASVRTSLVAADSDEVAKTVHEVHLQAAAGTLGAVTRPERFGRAALSEIPAFHRGEEPQQALVARRSGEATGYALLRRKQDWRDGVPGGTVKVTEVTALDLASRLALARRLVDFDLTVSTTMEGLGTDDPVIWWAGGPRAVKARTWDSLWIRLVDVDRALTARGWAGPCDVVLDVVDDLCPWNARRWRLTVDERGAATCEPTGDQADLRLSVQSLGAAYLGGRSLSSEAGLGLVEELRPGAVRRLSLAMRADVVPTAAIAF